MRLRRRRRSSAKYPRSRARHERGRERRADQGDSIAARSARDRRAKPIGVVLRPEVTTYATIRACAISLRPTGRTAWAGTVTARDRLTGQCDEFDLVTSACGVDHHDPTDVARLQSLLWQALGQDNRIEFLDHRPNPGAAYAVTNLGTLSPVATNQIAQIRGLRESGAAIRPSRIYFLPNSVSLIEITLAERACSSKASRKVCQTAISNPYRRKNAALARPAG